MVGKYITLARVAGVDWDATQTLSEEDLETGPYRPAPPRGSHQLAPDLSVVHQELERPGVTLMLLWGCGRSTPPVTGWPTSTPAGLALDRRSP